MPEARLCVGIVVVNDDKDVFVAKRYFKDSSTKDEYWQMPQGGIDPNETPFEAMARELEEETGIERDDIEVVAESKNWYTYEIPEQYRCKDFDSQQQKWFLVKFNGADDLIKLNRSRTHREFSEWDWTPVKFVSKLVIPFKKDVYKQVMKDFEWYF